MSARDTRTAFDEQVHRELVGEAATQRELLAANGRPDPWPERYEDLAWLDGAIAEAGDAGLVTAPVREEIFDDTRGARALARADALDRARRLRRIRAALG